MHHEMIKTTTMLNYDETKNTKVEHDDAKSNFPRD